MIALAETCNILVSSAGRRVALIRHVRASLASLGIRGQVFAADLTQACSGCQEADAAFPAPLFASGTFIPDMLDLCRKREIRLVIPTIDTELPLYADARAAFKECGTLIAVSDSQAVQIGCDKQATHAWLVEQNIDTPRQRGLDAFLADPDSLRFPVVIKPRFGSSSIGLQRLDSPDDLSRVRPSDDQIVQELAPGVEYTVDVYVDRQGRARCCVPRLRIETRAGEVSKGMTVRSAVIQTLAKRVCESLPGPFGVFNVQIFCDEASGPVNVIEFNPRFGGGYPLSHRAGAHFTTWLIEETMGLPCSAQEDAWRDGLVMLRFDDAIFVDRKQIGL